MFSCRTLYPIGRVCALHCLKTLLFCLRAHFPLSPRLLTAFKSPAAFFHFYSFELFSFMPSRKPMPSFTLVLTSGCHSLLPNTMQFDSDAAPKMPSTTPDYLMVSTYDGLLRDFTSFHDRLPSIYVTIRRMH